jgi:DNA-binding LacI/PurR family transcriptional regulator
MSTRPTLTDIAAELGLSISTVSNAYNRPDQLSAATREQVFAAAKRLGYAGPDPRASALRSGRAGAIGLIELSLPTALTDPASLLMLSGVAKACDEAGVALVLIPSSEERDSPKDIVRTAVVDGFVAHCDALDDERRAIVEDRRLPVVVLDGRARPDDPSVGIDEEGGASAAATHLIELGHRRLAIFAFPPHGNTGSNLTTERRRNGYLTAIAAAGIDPSTVIEVEGNAYDRAETALIARRILLRPDRPTAVLAMSDEMAVAVIDAANRVGLRVPNDLSVVGFDDTVVAQTSTPPLTTVHQPHAEKGAAAVRMLLEPNGDREVTFPVELIARGSTGPAPEV